MMAQAFFQTIKAKESIKEKIHGKKQHWSELMVYTGARWKYQQKVNSSKFLHDIN